MANNTDENPRRRGIGWANLAAQLPAVLASAGLLVAVAGPYWAWILAAWLLGGLGGMSRVGERFMLRRRGFFDLNPLEQAQLRPVAAAALKLARIRKSDIDWYVVREHEANAYAAGRRAVAVSTGMLGELASGRLSEPMIRSILVHELGHHATRATRFALVSMWLATPWRIASRLVIGSGLATMGRRQPNRLLGLVAVAAVAIAVVQTAQQGQTAAAAVLAAVGVCALVCPLTDAWVSRRSEYAADRFVSACGVGSQLVDALRRMDSGPRRQSWMQRALSRHPSIDRREDAMQRQGIAVQR